MKKPILSSLLLLIFLVSMLSIGIQHNMSKPRILILHSYHPDYAWTRDVNTGLKRVTRKWLQYDIHWHYMDTKKHQDKEWLKRTGIIARRTIDQIEPDVLIAIDDFAQSLAARHYVNHPQMNIVFAGVNGQIDKYGYTGAKNVTGIFEHKLLAPVKDIIINIEQSRPSPQKNPRLMYLMDPSASIKNGRGLIDGYAWMPLDYQGSIIAENFEQWQETVLSQSEKTDYIIVSNYRKLPKSATDPQFMPPDVVMQWTEQHSKVPVIGINSFNVEDGAMISAGVSPYEQGVVAGNMAQTIIEQKISAGDIPVYQNKLYVIALREKELHQRGIILPSVYEAFARATDNFIGTKNILLNGDL